MIRFSEWSKLTALAKQANVDIDRISKQQLAMGVDVEREHDGKMGKDVDVVRRESDLLKIAVAHLREDPKYYTKLRSIEK